MRAIVIIVVALNLRTENIIMLLLRTSLQLLQSLETIKQLKKNNLGLTLKCTFNVTLQSLHT